MARTKTRESAAWSKATVACIATILTLFGWQARAESIDVVEGRLTLTASYGFLATFYQDDEATGANPVWGHGLFLRLGGERCGTVCLGLSVLGSVGVSPASSGSIGVGPHVGLRWQGPSWAGSYFFRIGAAYYWMSSPEPDIADGQITFGENLAGHGVGAWLTLGLEILRGDRLFNPIVGISGRYVAVVSTDPVEHSLSAQGLVGFTIGRRMDFGAEEELDVPAEAQDEDEPDRFELDEDEERRLEEAEEELRRPPGAVEQQQQRLRRTP